MDNISNLKFFVRLVEKRGVAAAGKDFGYSPATASERLVRLEHDYGAKLVNRTTRSLCLTDEGRILFEGARGLINDAEDLKRQVRFGVERVSGPIKIAAAQDLGSSYISELLDKFMDANPDVKMHLHLSDQNLDLIAQGIDVAIRLGQMKDSTLRIRKLADNRRLIVASPAYLQKHGTPRHPDDLQKHNCLIMHWGLNIDREWVFTVNGRKKKVIVGGNRAANSGAQVKKWCLAGHGIAFKSVWDVKSFIKSGELVECLSDFQFDQESALQILYPGGNSPTRRVRALIDFLVKHFDDEDWQRKYYS